MCKLGTDLAAIDFLEKRDDIGQFHARIAGTRKATGEEFGIEIGLGQTEKIGVQHRRYRPFEQLQRIDVGDLVAAQRIDLNQPRDRSLLFVGGNTARARAAHDSGPTAWPGTVAVGTNLGDDVGVAPGALCGRAKAHEKVAPVLWHRLGVSQVVFVQAFDQRRIAAVERRGRQQLFERGGHGLGL